MRAVTFDCTVFSSLVARFIPPSRATASNTLRSAASMPSRALLSPNVMGVTNINHFVGSRNALQGRAGWVLVRLHPAWSPQEGGRRGRQHRHRNEGETIAVGAGDQQTQAYRAEHVADEGQDRGAG